MASDSKSLTLQCLVEMLQSILSSVFLGQSSRSLCGDSTFEVNPCSRLQVCLYVERIASDGDSSARVSELSNDKLPCFAP